MRHVAIRVCTDKPDYSYIPDFDYDWSKTVFEELKPEDAPEPLGNKLHRTCTNPSVLSKVKSPSIKTKYQVYIALWTMDDGQC